jgi:hypothetical protein
LLAQFECYFLGLLTQSQKEKTRRKEEIYRTLSNRKEHTSIRLLKNVDTKTVNKIKIYIEEIYSPTTQR